MKKRIHILFPFVIIPILIIAAAFIIDTASLTIGSFLIYAAIVYSLFAVLYGVFGKIWAAWIVTFIPVFILEIINLYKLKINGTPFLLSDFSLIGGLDKIIGFALPQIGLSPVILIGLGLFLLFTAFLIIVEPIYKKRKKERVACLGIGFAVLLILVIPFTHKAVAGIIDYEKLTPRQLVLRHGVVAGLYCAGVIPENMPPMTLTKEDIQSVIDSAEPSELKTEEPPTVIFLMSESFFDVDRLPDVSFSKDPIPTFHRLKKNYSTGKFLSNTYCGGTGYVEMEFLTGLCSKYLDAMHTLDSLPDKAVYNYMPSISDVFKSHGYSTAFIHSYNSSLYNREFIYDAFKFDEVLFDKDFTVPIELNGGYISDMTLANQIISLYESKNGEPSMIYAISMENHQPYFKDKYAEKSGIVINSDIPAEDKEMFEAYVHGLYNADAALNYLINYFSSTDKPVMLVFWGDHLPNLPTSNDSNLYKDLGYCTDDGTYELTAEDFYNMLTTDYVIWDNFGLEKKDKAIGAPMLGIESLERIGLEMNDYFKWLSGYVNGNYLVYSSAIFAPSEDDVYAYIPTEYTKVIDDYHQVVYDIVYGEHKFFGAQR